MAKKKVRLAEQRKPTEAEKKAAREQWPKSLKEEQLMARLGLKWETVYVNIDQVDWEAAAENYGRLGRSLDPERVEDYAQDLENGARLPRCTLVPGTKNGFVPASGRHRLSARELLGGKGWIAAYLVDIPFSGMEYEDLALLSNRSEGSQVDRESCILMAVRRVRQGMPIKVIAERFRVKYATLLQRNRAELLRLKAVKLGCREATDMADSRLLSLSVLKGNDKVFASATVYLANNSVPQTEITQFTEEVRKRGTEAQQLAFIERETEERRKEGVLRKETKIRVPIGIKSELKRGLSTALKILNANNTLSKLGIVKDSHDHKEIIEKLKQLQTLGKKRLGY